MEICIIIPNTLNMAFLEKADFSHLIDVADVDIITESTDADLDTAVETAQREIESYLKQRYDTDTMFAETGAARDKLLIKLVIDVALYEIFSKLNPRNIPEYRIQRRDDAIQYLKDCVNPRMNIIPGFPEQTITGDDRGFDISHGITETENYSY